MSKKSNVSKTIPNYWSKNQVPFSPQYPFTLNYWSGSDSEDSFRKHPKPGFTETSIIYEFNNYGFRGPNFDFEDTSDKIACFGCSITMGVGLNYEDTWVYKLSKYFSDMSVYNFGLGGTSGDTVARSIVNVIDLVKPKIIAILWPTVARFETYFDDHIESEGPWTMTQGNMKYFNNDHVENIRYRNQTVVDLLQKVYNFKLIEFSVDKLPKEFKEAYAPIKESKIDYARDEHPGPKWHDVLTSCMIAQYKEKYQ